MKLIDWVILGSIVLAIIIATLVVLKGNSQGCDGVCSCCKKRCSNYKK